MTSINLTFHNIVHGYEAKEDKHLPMQVLMSILSQFRTGKG